MSRRSSPKKDMTVKELKEKLRLHTLPTTGNKEDLQARLDMWKMPKADLQKKAKRAGLNTTGTKALLVRRIENGTDNPARCCNEPLRSPKKAKGKRKSAGKRKVASKRITPRKPRSVTPARCTIGSDGKKYYFKGKAPHKRISDKKAEKTGAGACVSSEEREALARVEEDIGRNVRASLGQVERAEKLSDSFRKEQKLDDRRRRDREGQAFARRPLALPAPPGTDRQDPDRLTVSRLRQEEAARRRKTASNELRTSPGRRLGSSGQRAEQRALRDSFIKALEAQPELRQSPVAQQLAAGDVQVQRVDDLQNAKTRASLKRSLEETIRDVKEETQQPGGVSLVLVSLNERGTPLWLNTLVERFDLAPGDINIQRLYENYGLGDDSAAFYLATATPEAVANVDPRNPVIDANILRPPPGLVERSVVGAADFLRRTYAGLPNVADLLLGSPIDDDDDDDDDPNIFNMG